MKTVFSLFALLLGMSVSLFAETRAEREYAKLSEKHDKELAAAIEPVNRRFREELTRLLRVATDAGDLDLAVTIKKRIDALTRSGKPTNPNPKPKPKDANGLREYLHGTTWSIRNGTPDAKIAYTITFNKNGTFQHSEGPTGKLTFTGPRSIKLWDFDPATFNEELTQFHAKGSAVEYYGTFQQ